MAFTLEPATLAGIVAGALLVGVVVGCSRKPRTGEPAPPPFAMPATIPDGVVEALAAGRKIDAIKLFRAATGCGLKDAKEACEALAAGAAGPAPQNTTGAR